MSALTKKACVGEGCDYEAMRAEGKAGVALAKTVAHAIFFRDDTDSPKGDVYRETVANIFSPEEQIRVNACANCLLTGCLAGHEYVEPAPAHLYGEIL